MNNTVKYKIVLEGNDIDTKKAQKLKAGDKLSVKRVNDAEDTFEICICHADGREIDMLTYAESVGVAPFIDEELITAAATVDKVEVKPGKSRRKDLTILTVNVEYSGENLDIIEGKNGFGFIDGENIVQTLATIKVLEGDSDILVNRPYLNLYTLDFDIGGKARELFDFEDGIAELKIKALFNESFTKCRISARTVTETGEEETELSEEEKQTVLTLVNHARIFEGEDGVNRETEE